MSDERRESSDREGRLDEAVASYLQAAEGGRAPDRREWLERYPDVVGELEHFFAGNEQFDRLAAPLRLLASPASGVTDGDEAGGLGRLGDFQLTREVGRGGMGVVYEAEQISLGRRVALKVLPFAATMDPRHLKRFHNEARAAASLDHPHIVNVHAVGSERAVHYYAMQFIEGQSLAEFLHDLRQHARGADPADPGEVTGPFLPTPELAPAAPTRDGRLSGTRPEAQRDVAYLRRVAEWGVQAAEALEYAHSMGVVHRDVKPANLMLDARGKLFVTDFGLARLGTDPGLTVSGDLVGTLRHMSPEQAMARHGLMDHRTDVYSLGATLYELLTLQPVISGTDRQELLRQVAFEEPTPPRRINRSIPGELETIVLKALEKNPQERYATAKELADDLHCFLEDQPIMARRPNPLRRLGKWARRYRGAVTSAAAGLLLTLLVLTGGIGWVVRDRAARRAARRAEAEGTALVALEEAHGLREQARWPEAIAAARRADELLGDVGGDALRIEVRQLRRDLEMVVRLEDIRLSRADVPDDYFSGMAQVDVAYAAAFREYGLEMESLPPQEAAATIRGSAVAGELTASLDNWALARRETRKRGDHSWEVLVAVARAADPDEWRNRVREALGRNDRRLLEELAASAPPDGSPITVVLLGQALHMQGASQQAADLLRVAQGWHPGDFWLNFELANILHDMVPPRPEEATRFLHGGTGVAPLQLRRACEPWNCTPGQGGPAWGLCRLREGHPPWPAQP